MPLFDLPFSLEIPVNIGNLKVSFLVSETLYAVGKECVSTPHNHGSHYELRYLVGGKGVQIVGETPIQASCGDFLLIYPGEYHYQSLQGCGDDLAQYNLRFSLREPAPGATSPQKRAYAEVISGLDRLRWGRDTERRLEEPFCRLTREISRREPGYFYSLQAMCAVIFTELLRLLPEDARMHVFSGEELRYGGYWRVRIDRFLNARYGEAICLQDLADAINLSKRQTQRLMQREYGMGYSQKLTETRIQYAKYQLSYTQKSLQQIAYDCGFQSYGYFLTCFRKLTGMSPGEFRLRRTGT
ncbi:MAG: helix-turn-helix domain-containing protein [Clostridia bacterium]|nr:helix-turn-helix domain-containing protein [Clostridia bacterium]